MLLCRWKQNVGSIGGLQLWPLINHPRSFWNHGFPGSVPDQLKQNPLRKDPRGSVETYWVDDNGELSQGWWNNMLGVNRILILSGSHERPPLPCSPLQWKLLSSHYTGSRHSTWGHPLLTVKKMPLYKIFPPLKKPSLYQYHRTPLSIFLSLPTCSLIPPQLLNNSAMRLALPLWLKSGHHSE